MRFHLGMIPGASDPEFGDPWRSIREPKPGVLMVISLPVGIASAVLVAILWLYLTPLDELSFQPSPIEILLTLAGIIVIHELLHAVATPRAGLSDKTIVGFNPSRLSFYAAYTGEITRNRCVAVFFVPLIIITILPLLLASIGRFNWIEMAGISIFNAFLSCGDLVGVTLIFFQIPRDGIIKNRGWRSYWRPPAMDAEPPLSPRRRVAFAMSDAAAKRPIPGRAIASVVFTCSSLWMFRVYGQVHWLPTRFSKDGDEIFRQMLSQVGPIRDQLDIGYRVLAVAALVWCIWSWRTEQRIAAVVATVFAALAMLCAVFIVI